MKKVVCITGVSGYLGTRLLHQIEGDPSIQKVVGIDRNPPRGTFSKLEFYQLDINAPLDQILKLHQVNVMIHLVFLVDPIHDSRLMHKINVEGTQNVLNACERAGVKRIIMASSGTAYGAHTDNPDFLDETDTLRGNKDYQYAYDKMLMEERCNEYVKKHPDCEMIVFRPCVIMGPHINNFISRYMIKKLVFGVRGDNPNMQFVHEDDIAEIFYQAIHKGQPGAYNVSPDGLLTFSEVAEHFKTRLINLPGCMIYPITDLAWQCRLTSVAEAPSGMLSFLRFPWVLKNSKLKNEFGYQYKHTSAQALDAYISTLH